MRRQPWHQRRGLVFDAGAVQLRTLEAMTMTQNMEADPFNVSLRKFLKQVGVTSQRAIEKTVEESDLKGRGRLTVKAVITAEGTSLNHVVEGEIDLG
jgi:hypothetical protein